MDQESLITSMLTTVLKPVLIVGGILLIFKFGIVALERLIKRSSRSKKRNSPSYERQEYLLTQAELKFYKILKEAVGGNYQIMCQISLSQVIQTRPMNPSDRQAAFNKISCKVLDFVLCDPQNLKIVAAIELDDSSHKRKDRVLRDKFLNEAMKDAAVPLIRFPVKSSYSAEELKNRISLLK